jgi:hypothetical protein
MTLDDLTKVFLNGNGQAFCSTQDRLRAALLFLADNGSEEISVRLCRVFYRIPSTDPVPMPLIDIMTDAIKEAIRAAAGGGE